mmetsp:Transcript_24882/g.74641  ORF Transcript_24882/g.74641 Transcript_24882/m.74641 type:complete len:120 (-) Transcript_24882:57-416(-)
MSFFNDEPLFVREDFGPNMPPKPKPPSPRTRSREPPRRSRSHSSTRASDFSRPYSDASGSERSHSPGSRSATPPPPPLDKLAAIDRRVDALERIIRSALDELTALRAEISELGDEGETE